MNFSTNDIHYPVRWNIKREPVFRLLDNLDHLESFFSEGQIMLSCFETFKKNPDEMRGDSEEGNSIVGEYGNGKINTHIVYDGGKMLTYYQRQLKQQKRLLRTLKLLVL